MRLVVAIGGNALLRRGQALSAENQIENIRIAAAQLARVATANELVLTHGDGPQIGLLALQAAAYKGHRVLFAGRPRRRKPTACSAT